VGVGAGASQLADVQRFARLASRARHHARTRRFDPHLTLLGWRKLSTGDERRVLALDRPSLVAHLLVDHVTLYQSRLDDRAQHTAVARATLT